MKYTPDTWVLLKLSSKEHGDVYKILAGWYGGYLSGDSWKLNSGIKKVVDKEKYWKVMGFSGSEYQCYKNSEKLSGYTSEVLGRFKKQAAGIAEITVVPMKEYNDS